MVNTENQHKTLKIHNAKTLQLGWTGSHSTLAYLNLILPILDELYTELHFKFILIADHAPKWQRPWLIFKVWTKDTEEADLLEIDIGLMPLPNESWALGKCGFKAIQYMALGIPALVSPIGVNKEIVIAGSTGYWCSTAAEWKQAILDLYNNPEKLKEMGINSRQHIINHYSAGANLAQFVGLFS